METTTGTAEGRLPCHSSPHPLLLEEELEGSDSDGSDPDGSDPYGSDSDGPDSKVVSLRPEDTLEGGEHLLYVNLQSEEHLQATAITSQRLAEASWKHKKAEAKIPEYLWEFEDVFSKETFDMLPPRNPWDHVM